MPLSAVRDYLAPTLEKVKDTAASLEKFSFTTEFKLTELHEKKESKKRVEKKAEIEVVDLKAEQKDLEATTSLVNVINQTLAEAEAVGARRGPDQTPQEGDGIPEHGC